MREHSVTQRLVAWIMVALLALVVGEPLRAHVCPMHDGSVLTMLVSATGDAEAADASHSARHGGATHDGGSHHAAGAGDDADAPSSPASHGCHCVGTCCSTAPVTAPAVTVAVSVSTALVATVVDAPAVPIAIPGTSDVVLPFAIGPPRVV